MHACVNGNTGVVKLLLDKQDTDVNVQNTDGETALMFSCVNGNTEMVKLLLDTQDTDVNVQDKDGVTALMIACGNGNTEMVKLLLDKQDIDVNVQHKDGMTALMTACVNGNIDIVNLLNQRQADFTKGCSYSWCDIIASDDEKILPITWPNDKIKLPQTTNLNSFALVENAKDYPWQPLTEEKQITLLRNARLFFKNETQFEKPIIEIMTLPWYEESVSLVRIYQAKEADDRLTIYAIEHDNKYFRLNGKSTIMHYLRCCAKINLSSNNALDYLRFFCFFVHGDFGAFNIVDPHHQHWQKNLLVLSQESQEKIVPSIIDRVDEKENFCCQAIVSYGFILFKAQFTIGQDGQISMNDDLPLRECIIRSHNENLIQHEKIRTPLIAATQGGHIKVVNALLAEGEDHTIIDHEGKTALTYAIEEDHKEIIELLKARGAVT
jgi:ankyrin repeat protein